MPPRLFSNSWRRVIEIAATAGIYYVAARISLLLAFDKSNASPVWPPSGIALAALLLFGNRVWPGIYLGALFANIPAFFANHAASASTVYLVSSVIALGNTLEAVCGAWLLKKFSQFENLFEQTYDVFKFAVCGVCISAISAVIGPSAIAFSQVIPWGDFQKVWFTWWLGDVAGVLVGAPLILTCVRQFRLHWPPHRLLELVFILALLFVGTQVIFGTWLFDTGAEYPSTFLFLPLLVWLAFRFGPREAAMGNVIMVGGAIWQTIQGRGPFVQQATQDSLLLLSVYADIVSISTLAMAAAVAERRRTEEGLRSARDELESRVSERTAALVAANKTMEAEMADRQRLESQFRELLESAPDAMVIVDQAGRIVLVNSQTETLFGYKRQELLGQSIELLIPDRLRERHIHHRTNYFSDPRIRPMGLGMELYGARKDGTEFPVEISLSPLDTAAGLLVSSAIRDITARKEIVEKLRQSERLAAIGQMAAGLAHDSRNALQQIQSSVERLTKRLKEGIELQLLADIQQAQNRLLRLLEDVRGYAAPMNLDRRMVNLPQVWREVWRQLAPFRKGREARIEEHTDGMELSCWADQICMERVFHNILLNSLAACSDPTVIEIQCSERTLNGQSALGVTVRDNGPGLNDEQQQRIFQPFYTTKTQGTGLGMSITKRIVEAHGGRIEIGLSAGHGAEIVIVLPSVAAE